MSAPADVARLGTPLTPAELRVLTAMKTADNEAAAARELRLSPYTIRGHLANARSRLGVRTTRQAIVRAGV